VAQLQRVAMADNFSQVGKREKRPSFAEAALYPTGLYHPPKFLNGWSVVVSWYRNGPVGVPKISFRVTTKPPNEPIGTVSDSYDRKACPDNRPRNGVDSFGYAGNGKSGECNCRKQYRGSYDSY
jgi:hypothetical protein